MDKPKPLTLGEFRILTKDLKDSTDMYYKNDIMILLDWRIEDDNLIFELLD